MDLSDSLLVALLIVRTNGTVEAEDLVAEASKWKEPQDGCDLHQLRFDGQLTITRDDDDTVDGVLERVNPVGHELAVDNSALITKALSTVKLTLLERGVTKVVRNSKL